MPRKRQGSSSKGGLTPSQKYHRKRHRSRSRSRSSSSENDKSDSKSENARSRSTRVSNFTTRTESRSRSAFQSVQHVGLQTERRQGTQNDANQTALHFNTDQFRNETSFGDMIQCQHCQAMEFRDESKGMCCSNGKVNPEPFPPLPQQLTVLFEGTTDQSVRFLQDIRKYNSAFQLTSLGCKEVRMNGRNPQFRTQGQVCHLIGPLEPADEMQVRFLQIYFMDGDLQIQRKFSITDGLCNSILLDMQEALNQNHKYVKELKCAYEFASSRQIENFRIVINETARPLGTHERTHNAPTLNEGAILFQIIQSDTVILCCIQDLIS